MYDDGRDGDDNGNGGHGDGVDSQVCATDNGEGTEITHFSKQRTIMRDWWGRNRTSLECGDLGAMKLLELNARQTIIRSLFPYIVRWRPSILVCEPAACNRNTKVSETTFQRTDALISEGACYIPAQSPAIVSNGPNGWYQMIMRLLVIMVTTLMITMILLPMTWIDYYDDQWWGQQRRKISVRITITTTDNNHDNNDTLWRRGRRRG